MRGYSLVPSVGDSSILPIVIAIVIIAIIVVIIAAVLAHRSKSKAEQPTHMGKHGR